jgi:hypothetical protein
LNDARCGCVARYLAIRLPVKPARRLAANLRVIWRQTSYTKDQDVNVFGGHRGRTSQSGTCRNPKRGKPIFLVISSKRVKNHYLLRRELHSISTQRHAGVRRRGLSDSYLLEGGRHTWRHSASPWSRPIDRRGWWNDAYVCFELVEIIGRPVISFSTALEFLLAD